MSRVRSRHVYALAGLAFVLVFALQALRLGAGDDPARATVPAGSTQEATPAPSTSAAVGRRARGRWLAVVRPRQARIYLGSA